MDTKQKSTKVKKYFYLKRTFDLFFAVFFLVLLAPTFVGIALAIKIETPGPIFYRQVRIGLGGKKFVIWKFRTMYAKASEMATGPIWGVESDYRVTKIGRFLRRTGMDELPYLLNVLCGNMSIVGPTAHRPFMMEFFSKKNLSKRLEVKPGIVGYWRLLAKEERHFNVEKMFELELKYSEMCSFATDLRILIESIIKAMRRRNLYLD
jgi:lipopolysaccharide/colanic/teichoic acid biosynthesis glycosyltransferase